MVTNLRRRTDEIVFSMRSSAMWLGWTAVAVGLVVMIVGWWLRIEVVASVLPGSVTMKFNTALGIAGTGLAVVAVAKGWHRRIPMVAGAIVLVTGLITTIEYTLSLEWSWFDELFSHEFESAVNTASPGRMGANTAVNYVLFGLSVLFLTTRPRWSRWLGGLAGSIGFVAFIGYVLEVPQLSGIGKATQMAINTSVLHAALGSALLLLSPPRLLTTEHLGGIIARRYMPLTLITTLLVGAGARWIVAPAVEDSVFALQLTLILVIIFALLMVTAISNHANTISEELGEARAHLAATNRELEQFAAVAAHDLRAPLRKIRMFLEQLESRGGDSLNEQGQKYLDRADRTAEHMQSLLEDILELSRIYKAQGTMRPVNLNETLDRVISDLAVGERGATVDAKNLPTIEADSNQMYLLFLNLVGNALKFTVEGRPAHIKVEYHLTASTKEFVALTVQDNGIGFAPDVGDRLFKAFERLEGAQHFEGTGIGLSICQRIVERHQGVIKATGIPGEGATFTIRLPRAQEPNPTKR